MERSARELTAVFFLLAALFTGIERAVSTQTGTDWSLPLVLFIVAAGVLIWDQVESRPRGATAAEEGHGAPPYREWAAETALPAPTTTGRGVMVRADDLERIEGVGPKIAAALVAAGLNTFDKIAQASEDELRAALKAGGMRLAPSLPTWPEQARLAASADWEGLNALQAELKAGRRP